MLQGLITDRTQRNVSRLATLSEKGWNNMTAEERIEWLGNPLDSTKANLIPYGPYYSSVVELKYKNQEIVATAMSTGTYLYAVSIIGEASNYENKKFTLSVSDIVATSGIVPQLAVYWHDNNGYEYAGASLLHSGSITFNTADFPNANGRKYLALYVYVTTNDSAELGAFVRFVGVMLNLGGSRSNYVPYVEIIPTDCTKGAYNYSDLNRVERAVSEISDIAGLNLVTKTDWTMWDVPTIADMERYLSNVKALRNYYSLSTELPTSMNNLTYVDANNIENTINLAHGRAVKG